MTIGVRPEGVTPDHHIDSPNTGRPHQNVAGHLRKAAELGGEFIWCDDDTFTLKPWTPGVYVRPFSIAYMLKDNRNRGYWSQAVAASVKVMEGMGYDPEKVPCGTVHRPWLVDPARALNTLDILDRIGGGSFKALYVAGLDGVIEANDIKIVGRGVIPPTADVVSLFLNSWGSNAGRIVREMFPEPSPWDTPGSVGGRAVGVRRRRT